MKRSLFPLLRTLPPCGGARDSARTIQRLEQQLAECKRERAAAAHDLRQPVAAIGLISELLRLKVNDPAALDLVDRLDRAANAMEAQLKRLQEQAPAHEP